MIIALITLVGVIYFSLYWLYSEYKKEMLDQEMNILRYKLDMNKEFRKLLETQKLQNQLIENLYKEIEKKGKKK